MRITITFLLFLTSIGCQKDRQSTSVSKNLSRELVQGNWKNFVQNEIYSEIIIMKSGNFNYTNNSELLSFSNGTWNVKRDTLYLNSVIPHECFFVSKFGPICRNPNILIEELIETTIENCEPSHENKYFIKFLNEKFIIRNDTLIHIPKCQNVEDIKFYK